MGKVIMEDVIIIGAGPAGLTAALYLARYEKKVLVLSSDIGGQASTSGEVGNYPGFDLISGHELTQKIFDQLKDYKNLEIKYPVNVESVVETGDGFSVKTGEDTYKAKKILITSGKRHRALGIDGEEELVGKGLSYCATCDGPFAKGKKTIVIGGGNSAADAAIILGRIAQQVTVLNLNEKMQAEKVRLDKIAEMNNIEIINSAKTSKLESENGMISGVTYHDTEGKNVTIEAKMVFVEIGYIPNTEIFKDLTELNRYGEIVVNQENETKTKGLYAAGDITDVLHKQIIIACGEGAKAAMSINLALEK
jgi:alkyl hydroperoxide reductase subunit F